MKMSIINCANLLSRGHANVNVGIPRHFGGSMGPSKYGYFIQKV